MAASVTLSARKCISKSSRHRTVLGHAKITIHSNLRRTSSKSVMNEIDDLVTVLESLTLRLKKVATGRYDVLMLRRRPKMGQSMKETSDIQVQREAPHHSIVIRRLSSFATLTDKRCRFSTIREIF